MPQRPPGLRIERVTDSALVNRERLTALLQQLGPAGATISESHLRAIVADESNHLLVAKLGDVDAGMLTLVVVALPSGVKAHIEDVVVDARFRGRGIAAALVTAALERARALHSVSVDLTSNPTREAANRLYARLGFERRTTNVYRMALR